MLQSTNADEFIRAVHTLWNVDFVDRLNSHKENTGNIFMYVLTVVYNTGKLTAQCDMITLFYIS